MFSGKYNDKNMNLKKYIYVTCKSVLLLLHTTNSTFPKTLLFYFYGFYILTCWKIVL